MYNLDKEFPTVWEKNLRGDFLTYKKCDVDGHVAVGGTCFVGERNAFLHQCN